MQKYVITRCFTADMSREYLQERCIPFVCFHFNSVSTVIGSHTGPGTVALFFVGDTRIVAE